MILMFFWKTYFWRENGRGRHHGAKGSGASSPDQKVGLLGRPLTGKLVLKISGLNPPPPYSVIESGQGTLNEVKLQLLMKICLFYSLKL